MEPASNPHLTADADAKFSEEVISADEAFIRFVLARVAPGSDWSTGGKYLVLRAAYGAKRHWTVSDRNFRESPDPVGES